MADSIKVFENSLREYLVNVQADSYNTSMKIQYRYNNLKVYMDPKLVRQPHFFVSLNISEACYGIDPLDKLNGSLGPDDRYVLRWAARPNINGELKKHWLYVSQQTSLGSAVIEEDEEEEEGKTIKNDQKKPIIEEDNFAPTSKNARKPVQRGNINIDNTEYVSGTGIKSRQNSPFKKQDQKDPKKKNGEN